MDAWKLKSRKIQDVSMERAEVELNIENHEEEEEEGELRRPHRAGPVLLCSPQ